MNKKNIASAVLTTALCLLTPVDSLAQNGIPQVRFEVTGFTVDGDNPLDQATTDAVLNRYVGEHIGLTALKAAADDLEAEIRDEGFSFRRVLVPPQRLGSGVVTLRIVDFKLGEIEIIGNEFFSDENILATLPELTPGEVPSAPNMSRAVRFANEHPAKNIVLTFRESDNQDAVDARIRVRDEKPWNVFALLNNTGSGNTGDERLSLGAQHNNLFNRDNVLTFSYTTAPENSEDVQQAALIYRAPLYRISGALGAYAVGSEVDSGLIQDQFEVAGRGEFFGLNYTHHLGVLGTYDHKVRLSLDDKRFDNDVESDGVNLGVDVRSAPATLSYIGNVNSASYRAGFTLGYRSNLSGGADNDDETYAMVRTGAAADWSAVRLDTSFRYFFPAGWWAGLRLSGQSADDPLIPGEQFGVGGAQSVRGFDERVVSGDTGTFASIEFGSPAYFGATFKLFIDGGSVEREDALPGEIDEEEISSAGLGIAWHWRKYVRLAVDAAEVTDGTVDVDDGETKTHVTLYVRY